MAAFAEFTQKVNDFFESVPKTVPHIPFDKIPEKGENNLPTGGYGEAYLTDDKKRVVKILHLSRQIDDRIIISLHNEIINYHEISSLCPEFFCKFIGYSYDKAKFVAAIIMENCGTDLLEYYNTEIEEKFRARLQAAEHNQQAIESAEIQRNNLLKMIMYKVLEAIDCLHQHNFAHLDIKPENIVIMDNKVVKFIDAGSLTKITKSDKKVHVFGTRDYMAPELFKSTLASLDDGLKKMDIYAYAKMVLKMLSPKEIFCMFAGHSIIHEMLDKNPDNRPSVREVMIYMYPGLALAKNHNKRASSNSSASPNKTNRRRIRSKNHSKARQTSSNRRINVRRKSHLH
jgi:serine/threonine protein kinase